MPKTFHIDNKNIDELINLLYDSEYADDISIHKWEYAPISDFD